MEWFRRSVGSFQAAWSGFPVSYRVLTGFLLVLLAFVAAWGVNAAGRDGWVRIVDRDRPVEDRAQIAQKLRERSIPFRVEGEAISVPASRADEAMLQLHSSGILGDEPFFKFLKETDVFATRAKTDRQWLLAVQGRLAALIQNLDFVRRAWVQIAEPADAKDLWWANGREATAAVILELEPGRKMTARHASGIAALVNAARKDIKPSNVKILDQTGRVFQVPDSDSQGSGLREQEFEVASILEGKALVVLPPNSRVAVTVRLNAESRKSEQKSEVRGISPTSPGIRDTGDEPEESSTRLKTEHRNLATGSEIEFISVAALVPDTASEVPRPAAQRAEYVLELTKGLRTATGALEKDISIRIAPITAAVVQGAVAASETPLPVSSSTWLRTQGPMILLVLLGSAALIAAYRLVRGFAPVADGGVVAEESLRAPGESILSAQDEALDRIRDGVRDTVTRNPREAADVARRWMTP